MGFAGFRRIYFIGFAGFRRIYFIGFADFRRIFGYRGGREKADIGWASESGNIGGRSYIDFFGRTREILR